MSTPFPKFNFYEYEIRTDSLQFLKVEYGFRWEQKNSRFIATTLSDNYLFVIFDVKTVSHLFVIFYTTF